MNSLRYATLKKYRKHDHFYPPLKFWDLIFKFFYSKNMKKEIEILKQYTKFKNTYNYVKVVSIP